MTTPSRQRFGQIVTRDEQDLDLAEAALLIACEEYPDLDVGLYLSRLNELGAGARRAVEPAGSLDDRVVALSAYLAGQQGFHGNVDEYYDPRNSFLNDVLDRKLGIPITLSAVYMEVGRRAGLDIQGVSFPGHFLVKVETEDGDLVIDPFHGGTLLSAEDCQQRLDRVYGGKVQLEASLLDPAGPKQMLSRMLRNLKAIYVKAEELQRALGVLDLLLMLDPGSAEDLRDRGLLYAALDCYARAAADLESFLKLAPAAPEAVSLADKILELRRRAARLN